MNQHVQQLLAELQSLRAPDQPAAAVKLAFAQNVGRILEQSIAYASHRDAAKRKAAASLSLPSDKHLVGEVTEMLGADHRAVVILRKLLRTLEDMIAGREPAPQQVSHPAVEITGTVVPREESLLLPQWYLAEDAAKRVRQVVVEIPPAALQPPRFRSVVPLDPNILGFMAQPWAALTLRMPAEGSLPTNADELVVFVRAAGVVDLLRNRPARGALAFYRLDAGGVLYIFIEVQSPEAEAKARAAFIVENPHAASSDLIDALFDRDRLEVCFTAPGEHGPNTAQFSLVVAIPPDCRGALKHELKALREYDASVPAERRDFRAAMAQFEAENSVSANPILPRPAAPPLAQPPVPPHAAPPLEYRTPSGRRQPAERLQPHPRMHRVPGVIAIEWDRSEVRAIEAELRSGRVLLRRALAVPLQGDAEPRHAAAADHQMKEVDLVAVAGLPWARDAEAVAARLRPALGGQVARDALVVAARDAATFKQLSLPPAPPEELANMVLLQAPRVFGVSSDDAVLDFAPLPRATGAEGQTVLAAVLNQTAFKAYEAVPLLLEARPIAMPLRPYAVAELVRDLPPAVGRQPSADRELPQPGALPADEAASLFVDSTRGSVELTAVAAGQVFFTRSARCEATNAQVQADDVVQEIRRTLAAIATTFPRWPVRRIVLAGDPEADRALAGTIQLRTDVPTEVLDPTALVELPPSPADTEALFANRGRFAALVGALLLQARAKAPAIDFLHPRRPPVKKDPRKRYAILGAAAAAVLLASSIVWYRMEMDARNRRIEALQRSIADYDERLRRAAPMQQAATAVADWAEEEVVWLDELRAFANQFPDTQLAYLNRLTMLVDASSDQGKIHFEAFARDRATINDFLEALALESDGRYELRSRGVQSSTSNQRFPERFEAEVSVVRPFGSQSPDDPAAAQNDADVAPAEDGDDGDDEADAAGLDPDDPEVAPDQQDALDFDAQGQPEFGPAGQFGGIGGGFGGAGPGGGFGGGPGAGFGPAGEFRGGGFGQLGGGFGAPPGGFGGPGGGFGQPAGGQGGGFGGAGPGGGFGGGGFPPQDGQEDDQ